MNTDLKKVLVLDPVVDVEESYMASEAVYKSGINKSVFKYTADSANDQNIIFNNITPPSLTTVTKRDLRIKYSVMCGVVFATATGGPNFNAVDNTGAPAGDLPPNPLVAGVTNPTPSYGVIPRAAPLQASASAIELRLNGSATSVSINDYVCVYPHILDNNAIKSFGSEMPLQADNTPVYSDPLLYYPASFAGVAPAAATNPIVATVNAGYSDARSPFAPYGINTTVPTRGSFVWTQVTAPTAIAGTLNSYAVYQITLVEQLFISPMVWCDMMDKSAGLALINNIILNIRFQDVNRMVSAYLPAGSSLYVTCSNSLNIPGVVGAVAGIDYTTPTLLIEYITQDPILAAKLPQTVVFDYSLIQPFITAGVATAYAAGSAAIASVTMQSLRLASIPSKLMLYARPSKSFLSTAALSQTTPDNFLRITSLQLSFNNRINLFATYTENDLYEMSVRNGLKDTFNDWKYNSGSIIIIDVARDIMLDSDEASGQANKYSTLQVTASLSSSTLSYWNQTTAVTYDFYILVEQPGKAFINASECQYILTGPSASEVLQLTSTLDEKIDHTELEGKGVGGSIFSSVGNLFKSGLQKFKNVNPEHVAKGLQMAQGALKSLGLGVAGGAVAGGAMRGKHSRVY